jgi:hypothetical protein
VVARTGLCDGTREHNVHALKVAMKDADKIYHRVLPANQLVELRGIVHVRRNKIDCRQHQQVARAFAIACRDGDGDALARKMLGNRRADKTGASQQKYLFHLRLVFSVTAIALA